MVKLKLIVDLQLPTIIQNLGRLRPVEVHFMLYSMWVFLEKHKCTMTYEEEEEERRKEEEGEGQHVVSMTQSQVQEEPNCWAVSAMRMF